MVPLAFFYPGEIMLNEIAVDVTEDESFSQTDAPQVVRDFVCGVCNGELTTVFAKAHWRVLVVCQEHGNITKCGRVTRTTVNIEMERSLSKFNSVIRTLSDLWGELIPPKRSREQNLKDLGF
jgi:hypothetical protein